MERKILLVDMDSVLADFELGFISVWKSTYPNYPVVSFEDRKSFHLRDDYEEKYKAEIEKIYNSPGFIYNLPEIDNAIYSIKMLSKKYDIFICTTTLSRNDSAISEKYKWIEEKLGYDWRDKIIVTKDKTVIRADFLIDDRPEIKGMLKPTWTHLLFDAPYNRHIKTRYRVDWKSIHTFL